MSRRAKAVREHIYGSERYVTLGAKSVLTDVPGNKNGLTLTPNTSVDVPISGVQGNGSTIGNPIFVPVFACASASAGTSCGTVSVSVVQSDNTTRALSGSSALITGPSVSNFLAWGFGGLTKAGDKAIRITSSGADASTTVVYRVTVWALLLNSAPVWNTVSMGGGNSPLTRSTSAFPVGAAVFMFSDAWGGSSASKSVTWQTPGGSPSAPAPSHDWLIASFNVTGKGTFPMYCALVPGKGTGSSWPYQITDANGSDWLDLAWMADSAHSWGIT